MKSSANCGAPALTAATSAVVMHSAETELRAALSRILTGARQVERLILGTKVPLPCFCEIFSRWHAVCIVIPAMLKIQSRNHDTGFEPAARFASDAEIELSDRLRRELEERYFGASAAPSTPPVRSGKDH